MLARRRADAAELGRRQRRASRRARVKLAPITAPGDPIEETTVVDSGVVVCHPQPGAGARATLGEDLLVALGKRPGGPAAEGLARRVWELAGLWLRAERPTHLVVLRAHRLPVSRWRDLADRYGNWIAWRQGAQQTGCYWGTWNSVPTISVYWDFPAARYGYARVTLQSYGQPVAQNVHGIS